MLDALNILRFVSHHTWPACIMLAISGLLFMPFHLFPSEGFYHPHIWHRHTAVLGETKNSNCTCDQKSPKTLKSLSPAACIMCYSPTTPPHLLKTNISFFWVVSTAVSRVMSVLVQGVYYYKRENGRRFNNYLRKQVCETGQ